MQAAPTCQIVISGVGGQGVLFITRLLAEAAILNGYPVFTSETHGMAQRGGTVISHLKIGEFASPLICPGNADGLIALKAESLDQHGAYLRSGAWAAVNGTTPLKVQAPSARSYIDADRVARQMDAPRSVNLIMLGFTLAKIQKGEFGSGSLYCSVDDIQAVLKNRLKDKLDRLDSSLRAVRAGAESTANT